MLLVGMDRSIAHGLKNPLKGLTPGYSDRLLISIMREQARHLHPRPLLSETLRGRGSRCGCLSGEGGTTTPGRFWYPSYTRLTRGRRKARDEIRDLLRAPASAAVGAGQRAPAPPGLARSDRAGRPAGLRLRVGGGAPLPRGVLALVRARGLPGRGEPANDEHPARPRHQ